ncbi:TPA: hypothetical protein ACGSTL_001182 [Vibrio parahaemolyticus]|uniref:hypothetical protein n=1 Tax=Vibrio campbellii TaxID=680 RepID=UPI001F0732B2|nr:hypothetical protein [Vibrio campbellii]UMM06605.1 hypothetical protein MKR81_27030 [Vibrio campbellii]
MATALITLILLVAGGFFMIEFTPKKKYKRYDFDSELTPEEEQANLISRKVNRNFEMVTYSIF